MARSILITGGAASGKTRFAASYFSGCDNVLYLRVGGEIDKDVKHRIEFDNKNRGVEWEIVSKDTLTPCQEIGSHKFVIFDSLSSFTRLAISRLPSVENVSDKDKKALEEMVINSVGDVLEKMRQNNGNIVIITIETGFANAAEQGFMAVYRDVLGRLNQRIANASDEVYFSASGIQFKIK